MTDYIELKRLAAAIESCTSIPEEDEAAWMRRTTGRAVEEFLEELQNLRTDNNQLIYALKQEEQSYLKLRTENERLRRAEKNDAIAYKAAIERQEELRVERNLFKAESDSLLKDAKRWRFICDEWPKVKLVPNGDWFNSCFLEREIDAAMSKEPSNG